MHFEHPISGSAGDGLLRASESASWILLPRAGTAERSSSAIPASDCAMLATRQCGCPILHKRGDHPHATPNRDPVEMPTMASRASRWKE